MSRKYEMNIPRTMKKYKLKKKLNFPLSFSEIMQLWILYIIYMGNWSVHSGIHHINF